MLWKLRKQILGKINKCRLGEFKLIKKDQVKTFTCVRKSLKVGQD